MEVAQNGRKCRVLFHTIAHNRQTMARTQTTPTRPDPAWLDRQYNNRALVPEHAAHFARWASDSAQARQRLPALLDVTYGHGAGETLDVFPASRKAGRPPAPVLVFIHGGYWRSLDKSDHSFVAPAFVDQGACVVVPNYALCPAVTIPQIALQMTQALAWVYRHIGAHGGDPQRITVVGHSAGGHLAAMLLACDWARVGAGLPAALVKNALSISGVFDLAPLRQTPFLRDSLRLNAQQVRQASPAGFPAPPLLDGRGELFAVAGADESDEFVRQNQLIQTAWGPEVVPVCETLAGLNHFSVLDSLVQPRHRLHRLAQRLLS
jgi:arylformamidase